MKQKVRIKFLNERPKEFDIKIRDESFLIALDKNKASIAKNKKAYSRKQKYKKDYK